MSNYHSGRLGLVPDAFYLGLISLAIQVAYARLASGFAGGNEIYLSVFFFIWLFFTGIGAIVIKTSKLPALFILLGILTMGLSTLFYLAPGLIGILPGQLIPPSIYLITLTIILIPLCLVNGGLFSSIAAGLKSQGKSGRTYWAEALGALIGGIIATIYYSLGGRDYSLVVFAGILCIVPIIGANRIYQATIGLFAVLILILGLGNRIEDGLLKYRYQPFDYAGSVSGRMIRYDAVKTDEITTLYAGGLKVADFPDAITGQEIFYWPYLLKPEIMNIALIGAETHMVDNYIPAYIKRTYIYPDSRWRDLIDSAYLPSKNNCLIADPVSRFRQGAQTYDAIMLNLGDLLSLYDKRLETGYFLDLCRQNLSAEGILCVRLPAYEGIWHGNLKIRINDVYNNLKQPFGEVIVIPGDYIYFIAGCGRSINNDMLAANLAEQRINSSYFTPALIQSRLNEFKLTEVLSQLKSHSRPLDSMVIGPGLAYYLARFNPAFDMPKYINPLAAIAFFTFLAIVAILIIKPKTKSVITVLNIVYFGLASFLFELMVMYSIQIIGGYLYLALGIVVSMFMLGLAGGSYLGTYKIINSDNLPNTITSGSVFSIILIAAAASAFMWIHANIFILLIILMVAGFAGGYGFAANARIFDNKPGLPYGIDLAGALIGALGGMMVLLGVIPIEVVLAAILAGGIILVATNKALC